MKVDAALVHNLLAFGVQLQAQVIQGADAQAERLAQAELLIRRQAEQLQRQVGMVDRLLAGVDQARKEEDGRARARQVDQHLDEFRGAWVASLEPPAGPAR